jgi:hypothetical protein
MLGVEQQMAIDDAKMAIRQTVTNLELRFGMGRALSVNIRLLDAMGELDRLEREDAA